MPSPTDPQDARTLPFPQLTARTERGLIRATGRSVRHAVVGITAPPARERAERAPVNLAIVLDRSGSMGGRKFVLARRAVEQALVQLQPRDTFALVVYDGEVDLLAASGAATIAARQAALSLLDGIQPRGSTDLSGGWIRGCEQLSHAMQRADDGRERAASGRTVNRCLLLTDGLANSGITDGDELIRMAGSIRATGIQTSTFGVGEDFDERLLAGMADAGGGNFYFLASAEQIPKLIASEVGEALEVVVPQASLEIRLAPGVSAEVLTRFHGQRVADGAAGAGHQTLRVELGDLVSEQQLDVVVALTFQQGEPQAEADVEFGLLADDGLPCAPAASLRWTYASHDANDRQPRDREVDRVVARMYAARARSEAVEYNRVGDYSGARYVLTATARRIRSYAGTDRVLAALASELLREAERFSEEQLSPHALKEAMFSARAVVQSKTVLGQSRKRGDRR